MAEAQISIWFSSIHIVNSFKSKTIIYLRTTVSYFRSMTEGMSSLMAIVEETKLQEKAVTEENRRLKMLSSIQNSLVSKQRETIMEVAKTSQELQEVEKKRLALKKKLSDLKTKTLIASSETAEVTKIIEKVVDTEPSIVTGAKGSDALKAIEAIQSLIFNVTEKCLKAEDLSADGDALSDLVAGVSEVIESTISTGSAKEQSEDTIRRQGYVISTMIPQPEEVADEE